MSQSLQELRAFTAKLLGAALIDLFPNIQLVGGAESATGFHYDCIPGEPLDRQAIPLIEERMKKLIKSKHPVRAMEMVKESAIELFRHQKQPVLADKIRNISEPVVRLTQIGSFYDLGHVAGILTTGVDVSFAIQSIDSIVVHVQGLPEMTVMRVSGTAFSTGKELKEYLKREKSAKKLDHRILGKELRLFETRSESPSGTWYWLPRGGVIRESLLQWWRDKYLKFGFAPISTPRLLQPELAPKTSEIEISLGRREYALSDSVSVQHGLVFQSGLHSYRDLPVRYCEMLEVFQNVCPGELKGMFQAAQYLKDAAHIFCTEAQTPQELISSLQFIDKTINILGFEYRWILVTNRENRAGSRQQWEKGVNFLVESLRECGFDYEVQAVQTATGGPKAVLQLIDALGRRWDGPHVGIDFEHPERLELRYQGPDDRMHIPIMIRQSLFGSLERFVAILLEHFAGDLPLWLAPEQVRVIPVTEMQLEHAENVHRELQKLQLRVGFEYKGGKLAEKIHSGIKAKIPYLVIIGDKEEKEQMLAVRKYDEAESRQMKLERLGQQLVEEATLRLLPKSNTSAIRDVASKRGKPD